MTCNVACNSNIIHQIHHGARNATRKKEYMGPCIFYPKPNCKSIPELLHSHRIFATTTLLQQRRHYRTAHFFFLLPSKLLVRQGIVRHCPAEHLEHCTVIATTRTQVALFINKDQNEVEAVGFHSSSNHSYYPYIEKQRSIILFLRFEWVPFRLPPDVVVSISLFCCGWWKRACCYE